MARGFLSGTIWGGILGLGVTGVASVLAPLPNPPQVSADAPDVVPTAQVPQAEVVAGGSEADSSVATSSSGGQVISPETDTLALDRSALAATDQPLAEGSDTTLAAPQAPAEDSGVVVALEAPVLPTPQALAPMAPQDADDVSVATAPAALPAPETAAPQTEVLTPAPEDDAPQAETEATRQPEAPEQEAEETAEAAPAVETTPSDTAQSEDTASEAPAAEEDQQETATLVPQPVPEAATEEPAPAAPEPEAAPAPAQPDTQVAGLRPSIGQPAGTLGDRDTGVTIRRPSSAPQAQVDDTSDAAEQGAESAATTTDDPRPIARFAQSYDDPAGKPLMSIVLIDDGSSSVAGSAGIAALRSFPYPLTFAVDASIADAEERMTIYRTAGFEVMAMVDLPEGAVATDAETTFGAVLSQMTQVVGVLEGTRGGLQGSREVADQVTSILLQTGHGLLTQDKGLNTMPKLARKEGVPADPIFRDFDSKGQTASVIRRFLDQAAFKAGQEGGVVMLGRLRPDTISALLLWGLQDRAGKVALVPVSAVLQRPQ